MSQGKSTVIIDQHGGMHIEEAGFTGTACAERTAKLLKGLKHGKQAEDKKPEFYSQEKVGSRQHISR